jgi:hypothetical protein
MLKALHEFLRQFPDYDPVNIIDFPANLSKPTQTMKSHHSIPTLSQFKLHALEQTCLSDSQSQVSFNVEIEHEQITQRIVIALLDENRENGAAVAIYPATGEVCDLTNGGGVIGYLSGSPLVPHQPVPCEILLYRFGRNCVCSVRAHGETFLYPAFMIEGSPRMTALVGHDSGNGIGWSKSKLTVSETKQAVA